MSDMLPDPAGYRAVINRMAACLAHKVEDLTVEQFTSVIEQAIRCGDFVRHVSHHPYSQAVTYVPGREIEELRRANRDLRAAVEILEKDLEEARVELLERAR